MCVALERCCCSNFCQFSIFYIVHCMPHAHSHIPTHKFQHHHHWPHFVHILDYHMALITYMRKFTPTPKTHTQTHIHSLPLPQTLTRTCPCATCVWLLHPALTSAQDGLNPLQFTLVVFHPVLN